MIIFKEQLKQAFLDKLETMRGEGIEDTSDIDKYQALGNVIRDLISKKWIQTNKQYLQNKEKEVSIEIY